MSSALMPFGGEPGYVAGYLPEYQTQFITGVDHYEFESTAPQADLDAAIANASARIPPPALPATELTPIDFQRRFTPDEFFAARQLATTDATMAYVFGLFDKAPIVHLDHADTLQGVGYMQAKGILTAERAAAILAVAK